MSCAQVISLDEWRSRRFLPDDDPPAAPRLRVVGENEPESGSAFTLDTFVARARVVLAERDRPPLHLVGGHRIPATGRLPETRAVVLDVLFLGRAGPVPAVQG